MQRDLRVSRDRFCCKRHRKRALFGEIAHFPVDNSLLGLGRSLEMMIDDLRLVYLIFEIVHQ